MVKSVPLWQMFILMQRRRQDFNCVRTMSRRLHVGRGPGDEGKWGDTMKGRPKDAEQGRGFGMGCAPLQTLIEINIKTRKYVQFLRAL